jgi:hypothetical protein
LHQVRLRIANGQPPAGPLLDQLVQNRVVVRTADGIAVNAEAMGERSNAGQQRTWSESGGPD